MSQRDLAEAVGREHSFVSRFELGDRRLDVVELYWILQALGVDPAQFLSELVREFGKIEKRRRR